jgi:hypothetical protein
LFDNIVKQNKITEQQRGRRKQIKQILTPVDIKNVETNANLTYKQIQQHEYVLLIERCNICRKREQEKELETENPTPAPLPFLPPPPPFGFKLPPGVVIPPPPIPPPSQITSVPKPIEIEEQVNEGDQWIVEKQTEVVIQGRIYVDGIPLPRDAKPLPPIPSEPHPDDDDVPIIEDVEESDYTPSAPPSVTAPAPEEYVGPSMPENMDDYAPMPSMYDDDDEGVTAPYPSMPSMYDDDEDEGVTAPYPAMPSMYDDEDEKEMEPTVLAPPKPQVVVPTIPKPTPSIRPNIAAPLTKPKVTSKMVPSALRVNRPTNAPTKPTGLMIPSAVKKVPTGPTIPQRPPTTSAPTAPKPTVQRPTTVPRPPINRTIPAKRPLPKKSDDDELNNFMSEIGDLL